MAEEPKIDERIAPAPIRTDAAAEPAAGSGEGSDAPAGASPDASRRAGRGPLSAAQKAGVGIVATLFVALIAVSAYFVAAPATGASGSADLLATTRDAQSADAPAAFGEDASPEVGEQVEAASGEEGVSDEASAPSDAPSAGAPAVSGSPATSSSDAGDRPSSDNPATVTVSVTVDSSAVGGSVSGGTTATFAQGATAYDALMACGLSVNASDSQYGVYVSAIGGLAEKEHGGKSGWVYTVNGADPGMSCSRCVLQNGDVVAWFYTLG
ncbi:DUF4430 domain-containing protein [Gordonibacter massiliensis (ex Traore et al. 2017)]|uniref:DUF4430 domain-containing protein n=1 Tax=Gordonibacter massiliensis (ex Traore et al. 2017) TaxID=1841863 RepID=A0A842JGN7_9ACTN|nr:DUF4430 domain-containing protein [Gordonibacter massiliensis (ex Traore et al. 2017)]MBC2888975.1 DUF4430 domain-containing protein [Gordonibacter massiliensis (ex Traore et al. 2017)]